MCTDRAKEVVWQTEQHELLGCQAHGMDGSIVGALVSWETVSPKPPRPQRILQVHRPMAMGQLRAREHVLCQGIHLRDPPPHRSPSPWGLQQRLPTIHFAPQQVSLSSFPKGPEMTWPACDTLEPQPASCLSSFSFLPPQPRELPFAFPGIHMPFQ